MKPVKWFATATAAGAAALMLALASSASAAQTDLCKVEESPCPLASRWEQGVNVEAKAEPLKFLTSVGTVECASSVLRGPLGAGGAPQVISLETLEFAECNLGTTKCGIVVLAQGGIDLLRTNFNLAEATVLNTEFKVSCGVLINCKYGGEPKLHLLGRNATEPARLTANEVTLAGGGGFPCPATNKLDATYTIITPHPVYVME